MGAESVTIPSVLTGALKKLEAAHLAFDVRKDFARQFILRFGGKPRRFLESFFEQGRHFALKVFYGVESVNFLR